MPILNISISYPPITHYAQTQTGFSISYPPIADYAQTQTGLFIDHLKNAINIVGPSTIIYRMIGYDNSLNQNVFWSTTSIDENGVFYTGPGPLTKIKVFLVKNGSL